MEQLYATKQKLVAFIISLKTEKKTELRGDVLAHCVQLNKNKRLVPAYISDENVVRMVNNRISKMAKNRKVKKNWSEEDVKILVWAVSKYADSQSFTALETDFTSKDW